jgi:hypothetical protein
MASEGGPVQPSPDAVQADELKADQAQVERTSSHFEKEQESYRIFLNAFRDLIEKRPDALLAIAQRDALSPEGLALLAEHFSTPDGRVYVSVAPKVADEDQWNLRLWSSEPYFRNNHANRDANMVAGTRDSKRAVMAAIGQMRERMKLVKEELVRNDRDIPENLNAISYVFEPPRDGNAESP